MKIDDRHVILTFGALVVMPFILSYGCSLEKPQKRKIRAHTEDFAGVAHGGRAELGPRYCKTCHGQGLAGGENGEPGCLTCHGVNWQVINDNDSRAPVDHTVENNEFMHHPGLASPARVCSVCHGAELEGDKNQSTPSCYLCHAQLWN